MRVFVILIQSHSSLLRLFCSFGLALVLVSLGQGLNMCHFQMKKKIAFFAEKYKDYAKMEERCSAALRMSGYRKELSHDAIVELKASLNEARELELRPLRAKLEGYRGLPPNNQLALAKLAEAEKELVDLTASLTREISSLHV